MARRPRRVAAFPAALFAAGGLLALVLGMILGTTPARADRRPTVAVLGLTASQDAARDLAFDLTGTLRWEARRVRGWLLLPKPLDPLAERRTHRCPELDDVCLIRIARSENLDGLVFGEVSATRNRRYSVALGYFDRSRGRVTRSVTDTFPQVAGDVDALRSRVSGYLDVLSGRRTAPPAQADRAPGAADGRAVTWH